MIKKYFMTIIIFCLVILLCIPTVKAEEESLDREMAIASALSYIKQFEGKTVGFNTERFLMLNNIVNTVNAKFNIHDFADMKELDDWTVVDYRNHEIAEKGLAAFLLQRDNDLMLVIRGTDMEWYADIVHYGMKNHHNQEEFAINYGFSIAEEYSKKGGEYNLYICGHSLGGYMAQIVGAQIEQNKDKYNNINLKRIVTFNGMGMNFFTFLGEKLNYGDQKDNIETLKKLGDEGRLVEYYQYGDLVSALGVHYGEMRMLYPSIDSVQFHRTNFKLLSSGNKVINLTQKLRTAIKKDKYNVFKTEIDNAMELYDIESLIGYVLVTHEADGFVGIETDKSMHEPFVEIREYTGLLSEYFEKTKDRIETKKSISLMANTKYASAKKYVWEVSTDKKNWTKVKVSTVNPNDPEYNSSVGVTNILDININDFKQGETKYYRVTSYYNDNYESSKYNFNKDKGNLLLIDGEYEYVVNEEKAKQEESKTTQEIIEIKRPEEPKVVTKIKEKVQTLKSKVNNLLSKLKRR